jgi:hypothetical protein
VVGGISNITAKQSGQFKSGGKTMITRLKVRSFFRNIQISNNRLILIGACVVLLALALVLGVRRIKAVSPVVTISPAMLSTNKSASIPRQVVAQPDQADLQRGLNAYAARYQAEADAYLSQQKDLLQGQEADAARYQAEANAYLKDQADLQRGLNAYAARYQAEANWYASRQSQKKNTRTP